VETGSIQGFEKQENIPTENCKLAKVEQSRSLCCLSILRIL